MYSLQDIYSTLSGDISFDAKGDLRLGTSFESTKAVVNFIAKTDRGGYSPDPRVGGDIGIHIGDKLTKEVTLSMEGSIKENLARFVLNTNDFQVHVIPVTNEDVGVFIGVGGDYIDSDGNSLDVDPEVISYTFPYYEGSPSPDPE
jgi:hypothetical protein